MTRTILALPFLRHRGKTVLLALAFVAGCGGDARAQASASYRCEEHAFNAGGRPLQGTAAASASYAVTLDALGDAVAGGRLIGRNYGVTIGFGASHPPAGEVEGLQFLDIDTLAWQAEPAALTYNLYRGSIASLASGSFGDCFLNPIGGITADDAAVAAVGSGFFYLVSAVSGLAEEGTLGFTTKGVERIPALSCP